MTKLNTKYQNPALDHALKMAYEEGYQAGLYAGILEAHRNSNGRTPHPDTPPGKRIVAVGHANRDGVAFDHIEDWLRMLAEQDDYDRTIVAFLEGTGRV